MAAKVKRCMVTVAGKIVYYFVPRWCSVALFILVFWIRYSDVQGHLPPHAIPYPEFDDRPIQLVKPDLEHKRLVLLEDHVKLLYKITIPVATVAVVGKFHSGKSFLMNQLMGKSSGFGIGPSVRPHTMGIWMWGRPMEMELAPGQKMAVIFLDTEGFAANNVSENYDAKIFAVATLLSSHLIYNSVKIIDQADIDYLELLARRTQLFALRAQMSRSKWTDQFNHALLSFPPLIWIVQDFVQTTVEEETPTKWLHRLMTTHTRENEEYEISLLDIFKSVECFTMFLPAVKKNLLNDLSQATEEDLTTEYKEERSRLLAKLRRQIVPKVKNNESLTGSELAGLLEILVSASNDGLLTEVPSRWATFVQKLEQTATADCLRFYEADMNQLYTGHNDGPIKTPELQNWHEQSFHRAKDLLEHLLRGLDTKTEGHNRLRREISTKHVMALELNDKKIKLHCSNVLGRATLQAETSLKVIALPLQTSKLRERVIAVTRSSKESFTQNAGGFVTGDSLKQYLDTLEHSVLVQGKALQLSNNELIQRFLQDAVKHVTDEFVSAVKNDDKLPRTPKVLQHIVADANSEALTAFQAESAKFKEEDVYRLFVAAVKEELLKAAAEAEEENKRLVEDMAQNMVQALVSEFDANTAVQYLQLPMQEADLRSQLQNHASEVVTKYNADMEDFTEYPAYSSSFSTLQTRLSVVMNRRHTQNVEAFAREVERPLLSAKKVIQLSADKYTTVFSLQRFMTRVCLLHLNEGKAQNWSPKLQADVISHFIARDQDLSGLLAGVDSLWSRILGFLQWVLWMLWLW